MDILVFPSNGYKPHQKVDSYILPWKPSESQQNTNPENTEFHAKKMISRDWSDKTGLNDTGFKFQGSYTSETIEEPSKIHALANSNQETQSLNPGSISAKVLIKTKETAKVFLGKKVTQAIATVSTHFNDTQRQVWNKPESPHKRKRIGTEVKEMREKVKVKTIQWVTCQYKVANDLTKKEDTDVEKTQVEVCKTDVHR